MVTDQPAQFPVSANPALMQVQDFVQESAATPVNPVKTVMRLLRGQFLRVVLLSVLAGLGLAVAAFSVTNAVYESQGLVRLVAKEPKILYADNDDSRLRLYDAFVSAEATYLQSQQVITRAHEILLKNLDKKMPDLPRPGVQDIADAIEVKKLKGLISIQAKSANPALAQMMVNAHLEGYLDLQTRQSDTRQTLRARELEARVQELLSKQHQLGKELLKVGEEYDASSLAKAHLAKVTQLEELDIRIDELRNALVEMEAANGALDADTGDMEIKRATLLDRAMADMVFERAKRAAELEKLQLRYMPDHPKVATLAASLKVIDDAIESRRRLIATLGKTGAITGTDGAAKSQSIAELQALKRKLTSRRQELSEEAKVLNGKLIELKRINAEQSQVSGMLAETRRILDQVLLESRNSLPGTVETLSRGSAPEMPAEDKRKQFAALGFLAGAGFVVVLLVALRQFSSMVRYSDDLPASVSEDKLVVIPQTPDEQQIASFISELQLQSGWRHGETTVVSVTRFSEDRVVPLTLLANASSEQGLKTLLVCASADGISEHKGFAESILKGEKIRPLAAGGFDFLPFGQLTANHGFSVEAARKWLQSTASEYDLIIVYCGVSERHYASRVLPKLADISIAAWGPGDQKRLIQRFVSQSNNLVGLFAGAAKDDPGIADQVSTPENTKGKAHEQAA